MNAKLVLGAGCFWGVEVLFEEIPGVKKVISGYAGGHTDNPTYDSICTGTTGHIEVVEIEYDDSETTYEILLDKFFFIHDPTQFNRQGPDIGEQYKSVIFYNSESEKTIAEEKIKPCRILLVRSFSSFLSLSLDNTGNKVNIIEFDIIPNGA